MYVLVCVSVCMCGGVWRVYVCPCTRDGCVRVYEKKKRRDREKGEREKNKPCFLLSHFQLYELQPTFQRSIELNLNPASSYSVHSPHIFTVLCS